MQRPAGAALYLVYVVYVGGDFMSGRFLTAPFFCAVVLGARHDLRGRRIAAIALAIALPGLGLATREPSFLSGADYGSRGRRTKDAHGISNERRYYFPSTGLIRDGGSGPPDDHPWAVEGVRLRETGEHVAALRAVGMTGFYAGPDVHIVDRAGLCDPLLARLPPRHRTHWRPGHLWRRPPDGYLESLRIGENRLESPDLAAYYDKLSAITRGRLFDPARMSAIVGFLFHRYDHLIDTEAHRHPLRVLAELERVSPDRWVWEVESGVELKRDGLELQAAESFHASRIELVLTAGEIRTVVLLYAGEERARIEEFDTRDPTAEVVSVTVPDEHAGVLLDALLVLPRLPSAQAGRERVTLHAVRVED